MDRGTDIQGSVGRLFTEGETFHPPDSFKYRAQCADFVKMYWYALIDLVILSFPLAATFYPRIGYYKKLPALFVSIGVVGGVFIVWDVIATMRGDWVFNYSYLLGISFAGLPLEELLFFAVVPYSCIFIYESLNSFFVDSKIRFSRNVCMGVAALFLLSSFIFYSLEYTATVLFLTSVFLFYASMRLQTMLSSRFYWAYMGVTTLLFMVFNYFLTSIPVVVYGADAIWNIRFITIPLEDFIYNYLMLSLYLAVYLWAKNIFEIR